MEPQDKLNRTDWKGSVFNNDPNIVRLPQTELQHITVSQSYYQLAFIKIKPLLSGHRIKFSKE